MNYYAVIRTDDVRFLLCHRNSKTFQYLPPKQFQAVELIQNEEKQKKILVFSQWHLFHS